MIDLVSVGLSVGAAVLGVFAVYVAVRRETHTAHIDAFNRSEYGMYMADIHRLAGPPRLGDVVGAAAAKLGVAAFYVAGAAGMLYTMSVMPPVEALLVGILGGVLWIGASMADR